MRLTAQQAETVADNHKLIYSFLKIRNLNVDDWYDVCAIAFCRSVASFDSSHGTKLSTYAYGAMDFAVMSLRRSLNRKEMNTAPFSLDDPIGSDEFESLTYLDMFGEEDKSLLSLENRELVDYCLSRLSPLQRKAIGLHSMGVTTHKIGKMTGYSQPYISRVLSAARGKINIIRDKQFCSIPHHSKEEKQMTKSKFTDDEIYALIDEGKTNAQIGGHKA